jgi:hypothetical protein
MDDFNKEPSILVKKNGHKMVSSHDNLGLLNQNRILMKGGSHSLKCAPILGKNYQSELAVIIGILDCLDM